MATSIPSNKPTFTDDLQEAQNPLDMWNMRTVSNGLGSEKGLAGKDYAVCILK